MIAKFNGSFTIDGENFPSGEHVLTKEQSEHWYLKALVSDGLVVVVGQLPNAEEGDQPLSAKELRAGLKAEAEELGLEYAKNITTDDLAALVAEAKAE